MQQKLFTLVHDLNTVYQMTLNTLITRATDEIRALLHASSRGLQRLNVQTVAIFHQKVVDVSELTPDLHPMALSPLEDIEGVRQRGLERHAIVRVCRQECERVLAALAKLLSAASEVISPPVTEPVKIVAA